jgi:hypothetical protein
MYNVNLAMINACTVLSDAEIQKALPAFNKQLARDFAPIWGVESHIRFIGKGKTIPKGYWWISILDDADGAGYLGYHDLTPEGYPLGKAFAKTDIDNGYNWTITATHEILEMLIDPSINLVAFIEEGKYAGKLFAYEVCDACEADELGYNIDGTMVSDFVTLDYFEWFHTKTTGFDFRNKIKAPFQILPGGYMSVYDIRDGNGWQQITAQNADRKTLLKARPPIGSRRERRRIARSQWVRSKPDMNRAQKL